MFVLFIMCYACLCICMYIYIYIYMLVYCYVSLCCNKYTRREVSAKNEFHKRGAVNDMITARISSFTYISFIAVFI